MANDTSTSEVANQEPLEGTLVRSRAWHAYQLKMAGLSLAEIAERQGFSSPGAVAKAIKDEIMSAAREIPKEDRDTILQLEMDRLNFAQSKIWPSVEYGDLKAIETLLKIIQVRSKLQGLDMIDPTSGTNTVLVVGGSEADYIERLRNLADQKPGE